MYKNILSFIILSFNYLKSTDGLSTEGRRLLSCTQKGRGTNLQWTHFFSFRIGSKYSWLYNIPNVHVNSCFHTSSNLPLTRCTWLDLQLATYKMHLIVLPSSMAYTQFTRYFYRKTLHPVYFCHQVNFLLFLFPVCDFCSRIDKFQRGLQVLSLKTDLVSHPTHSAIDLLNTYCKV